MYPNQPLPRDLENVTANENDRILIKTPLKTLQEHPGHPPFLVMRFDALLPTTTLETILQSWDLFISTSPVHKLKNDKSRSTAPAFHLGVWEVTFNQPRTTAETRQASPTIIEAMDRLLGDVKTLVVPKIVKLLKRYLPVQWEKQKWSVN